MDFAERLHHALRLPREPIVLRGDGTALVRLTRGYVATIDAADVPLVAGRRWYLSHGYAVCNRGRWPEQFMHRVIMGAEKGRIVDHANRDRLDNRRANLRFCTVEQSAMNQVKPRSRSRFRGVYWDKYNRRWRAEIIANRVRVRLGRFKTEEGAAAAYDAAARELHGEFAVLNGGGR